MKSERLWGSRCERCVLDVGLLLLFARKNFDDRGKASEGPLGRGAQFGDGISAKALRVSWFLILQGLQI